MAQTVFQNTVTFLSNNFELLIYLNASLALLFLIGYFGVKFTDQEVRRRFSNAVRSMLFTVIVTGQVVFFTVLGILYWKNYQQPAPQIGSIADALPTTRWVHSDIKLYFIDGSQLRSIQLDGSGDENVFSGQTDLKSYTFSPDGQYIAVVSQDAIYLVDRTTSKSWEIDRLFSRQRQEYKWEEGIIEGNISGVQWAPDSKRLLYEMARWSKYASQDQIYVYTLADQTKQGIRSPTRKISSIYWGRSDGYLYYLRHETQRSKESGYPFQVKVYRIPLATLSPELVTEIPFDSFSVPFESLDARGIYLYTEGSDLAFGRTPSQDEIISENGSTVGIDDEDYLYYVRSKWFRKRLYSVPREAKEDGSRRYNYRGGDLVVDNLRWIPGGRYVVMEHKYWGVLVLEPATGKIGLLIQAHGHSFGWYAPE